MTAIRKATQREIRVLSRKLLTILENKDSQIYQDNVAKFGIPEEYVRKAFAEERLLKTVSSGETTFYLALENNEIIGFAQIIQQDPNAAELDRIVVFPKNMRKDIGTQLLKQAIMDQERKGIKTVAVNAGKDETHARRFYEKNGFKQVEERTVETPWGKELTLVNYQLQLKST